MKNSHYRLLADGDPENGMQPSDMTALEAFTTDDKSELNHTLFQTDHSRDMMASHSFTAAR